MEQTPNCKYGNSGSKVFACGNDAVEGEEYCYLHLEFSESDGRMVYTRDAADREVPGVKALDQFSYPIRKDVDGQWRLENGLALDGLNGQTLEDFLPFWVVG